MPCGSSGESPALSNEERKKIIETVVEKAKGRVLVIGELSPYPSTRDAVELAKCAEKAGADAVSIMPPVYNRLRMDELYNYFKTVADNIEIGIAIHNDVGATKTFVTPEMLLKLVAIEKIVAIKESHDDFGHLMASLRFCGDKIAVIGASEPNRFIMHHFMLGIPAVWLGLAGALPELVVGIHKAVVKGDMDSAKALSDKLATYVDLYMCEYPDYIRYYKACVALRGLPAGPTRPPLLPLSPENMNKARMTLRKIGIL